MPAILINIAIAIVLIMDVRLMWLLIRKRIIPAGGHGLKPKLVVIHEGFEQYPFELSIFEGFEG